MTFATAEQPKPQVSSGNDYIAILRAGAAQQAGAAARRESALAVYLPANEAHAELGSIFALAEGVGPLPGSALAGKKAVDILVRSYYESTMRQPGNRLQSAIAQAGQAIFSYAEERPQLRGMGSSLCCAVVVGDRLWLAGVGNTRAYLLRLSVGKLELLTPSYEPGDAATGPALGISSQPAVFHIDPIMLGAGDIVILCSVGLGEALEEGDPRRFIAASGETRGGVDAQGLAETLAVAAPTADDGAAITITCKTVVPRVAALQNGWPRRYARQVALPLAGGANRPATLAPTEPPSKPAEQPRIAPPPDAQTSVPAWLRERQTIPPTDPLPRRNATDIPKVLRDAPGGSSLPRVQRNPAPPAVSGSGAMAASTLHGAPQWLSYLVIIAAIGILSTMAGVMVGLGPQYWLSVTGIAVGVIVITAVILGLLHRSRRARPQPAPQPAPYRLPRRPDETVIPDSRKLGPRLRVSSSKIDFTPLVGNDRPSVKVDIMDEHGTVVGCIAVGAPDHLIDAEAGKPCGFYVLLWDAVTRQERARAWMAPGATAEKNMLALRDMRVAGEDPRLRVSTLRGGATFTVDSPNLIADLELLFYDYTDSHRKNAIKNVQIGVVGVRRVKP